VVRAAFSGRRTKVLGTLLDVVSGFSRTMPREVRLKADATYVLAIGALVYAWSGVRVATSEPTGPAAVTEAVVWALPMAAPDRTQDLSRTTQAAVAQYRQREQLFHSKLTPPPGATAIEREMFQKRVAIERVLFCLFPRREIARVAAGYASDADVAYEWEGLSELPRREAAFVDGLLGNLQQQWLAPYLNLIAAHRKLCASQLQGPESDADRRTMAGAAREQLKRARDGGHPVIRVAAEHLLTSGQCLQ
jgi:hypothetical protein